MANYRARAMVVPARRRGLGCSGQSFVQERDNSLFWVSTGAAAAQWTARQAIAKRPVSPRIERERAQQPLEPP